MGKAEKNVAFLMQAKTHLLRALYFRPWDNSILYNLALAQQEFGVIVLRKDRAERTVAEIDRASVELGSALK